MSQFIVDTNVPIVANNRNTHASVSCVNAAIEFLLDLQKNHILLIDSLSQILHEYMSHLSLSGQPGAGDLFMKWVWQNQGVQNHVVQIVLPYNLAAQSYNNFPIDVALSQFDPSDRKFVSLALASGNSPKIVNCVDTDWSEHFTALSRNGVNILFLCPQHVSASQ